MIPSATTVGPVSLFVPDLNKSVRFYEGVLGFKVLSRDKDVATLGSANGNELIELVERPAYIRPGRRSPGLFHFAILFPSRSDLGRALIHLSESGWQLTGAGDHLVSEALYLDDPDGNGIELYVDRPRETWPYRNGHVHMDTLPVDIDSLIAEAKRDSTPWEGLPAGTIVGHVHLKVSDIDAAARFYNDLIGFDLMTTMPQALFVAAGGYHHHLGLNTWMTAGAPPAPEESLGLNQFSINLPNSEALDAIVAKLTAAGFPVETADDSAVVRDPSHNRILLRIA